jgi:hypothetical protein
MSTAMMLKSTTFDAAIMGCGIFWSVAYVLIIRRAYADKAYGMPLAALCANLSWEFISAFTEPPPGFLKPISFIWLSIDIIIALQVLKYGPAHFQRLPTAVFYGMFMLTLTAASAGMWLLNKLFMSYYDDHWGLYAGFVGAMMMAALFIFMLYSRGSAAGQSITIAACMLAGNSFPALGWLTYPPPGLRGSAIQLYLICGTLILDIVYIAALYRVRAARGNAAEDDAALVASQPRDRVFRAA